MADRHEDLFAVIHRDYVGLLAGLLLFPVLGFANYHYARPHNLVLYWANLALFVAVYGLVLIDVIRRMRRHRRLLREGADTLRAFTAMSVASLEAEMQEYRAAFWTAPLFVGLTLLSAYGNHPVTEFGWQPFALRAGLILGLVVPMGLIFWRHYRRNLKPDHARRQEILGQLS